MHYCEYKFNLVVKTLNNLEIIYEIVNLVKVIYAYFSHSFQKCIKFHFLPLLMKTKEFKLFKNIYTKWCSLTIPLKQIFIPCSIVIAKIHIDKDDKNMNSMFEEKEKIANYRKKLRV